MGEDNKDQEIESIVYEYKLRIPFKCLNRADLLLREGEIESLRSASCEIVWIGAYSGSQKILDAMEKGITVEQVKEATQRIHKAGISVGYFLQFGYPGESHDDIMQTIRLVIDQQPDDIGISVSYPLPGTPFYERVKSEIGKKKNWTDSNDLSSLYKSPYPTRYYRPLYKVVHKIHRLSKGKKRDHLDHLIHSKRSHAAGKRTKRNLRYLLGTITLPIDLLLLNIFEWVYRHNSISIRPRLSRTHAALPSPQDE